MWVTLVQGGAVARVSPTGEVSTFSVGEGSRPSIIAAGPDGALWFTRSGDDRIGRITTAGELSSFELRRGSAPFGITAGPDDALWFTTMSSGEIGRIGTDGEISTAATVGGMPSMITEGPDGALWFTLNETGAVGRLTVEGSLKIRELPTAAAGPVGIAATMTTRCGSPRSVRTRSAESRSMTPSRSWTCRANRMRWSPTRPTEVWVSLWGADQIARISGDGEVVTIDLPSGSEPHGLAIGPDGACWVALECGFVLKMPT